MQSDLTNYETATLDQINARLLELKANRVKNSKLLNATKRYSASVALEGKSISWHPSLGLSSKERKWRELQFYQNDPSSRAPTHPEYNDFLESWVGEAAVPSYEADDDGFPVFPGGREITVDAYLTWKSRFEHQCERLKIPLKDYVYVCYGHPQFDRVVNGIATQMTFLPEYRYDDVYQKNSYRILMEEVESIYFSHGIDRELRKRLNEQLFKFCKTREDIDRTYVERASLIRDLRQNQRGTLDDSDNEWWDLFFLEFDDSDMSMFAGAKTDLDVILSHMSENTNIIASIYDVQVTALLAIRESPRYEATGHRGRGKGRNRRGRNQNRRR